MHREETHKQQPEVAYKHMSASRGALIPAAPRLPFSAAPSARGRLLLVRFNIIRQLHIADQCCIVSLYQPCKQLIARSPSDRVGVNYTAEVIGVHFSLSLFLSVQIDWALAHFPFVAIIKWFERRQLVQRRPQIDCLRAAESPSSAAMDGPRL